MGVWEGVFCERKGRGHQPANQHSSTRGGGGGCDGVPVGMGVVAAGLGGVGAGTAGTVG